MQDPDLDRFGSRRSTVYAPNGIVATSQPLAAEAGVHVLRTGGNAFDAAVATAAALNVVEPNMTGLGGDVFAMYRTADGDVGSMRSCGGAPADATIDAVRSAIASDRDVDPTAVSMPDRGPHTVTVPGTARGWEATVEDLGTLTLEEALEPAIEYARDGYPVTAVVADQWRHADDLFTDANAREAYLLDDAVPRTGDVVRLPRLADSLESLAEQGADAVYEGAIGEAIVDEVQSHGGLLTMGDLAAHEVEWPAPVSTTYRGAEIYELPPNNQGLIALEALNVAEALGAGEYGYDTADRVHYFVEAMKRAFVDGHHYISDPDYESVPDLAAVDYAHQRAGDVTAEASTAEIGVPNAPLAEDGDTVLLCVADDAGNVVSYINSRFAGFGSGLVAGDTGIALQNRGSSFSLDPDHPNRLEPGKRPFHTLIPAVAHLPDDAWAAFGVMGGFMQPQGHVQLLSNVLDYGMSLQRALDEPRWRYREDGTVAVEARFDSQILAQLARRGHDVRVEPASAFGGGQIVVNDDGVLSGGTEPRKDGLAVGY
jgi:gamma-glutamyltranspeptidase/glutathione hydrolase